MQSSPGGRVLLSASDLVGHLNCRYLTALDLAVARGELEKPAVWDPVLDVLAQRLGRLSTYYRFNPFTTRSC